MTESISYGSACCTCRFSRFINEESEDLDCLRYPPVVVAFDKYKLGQRVPVVQKGDWCGEWEGERLSPENEIEALKLLLRVGR